MIMATTESVSCGGGELGGGKANTIISSIKHRIEPLKKSIAIDKVEALSAGKANIVDD